MFKTLFLSILFLLFLLIIGIGLAFTYCALANVTGKDAKTAYQLGIFCPLMAGGLLLSYYVTDYFVDK